MAAAEPTLVAEGARPRRTPWREFWRGLARAGSAWDALRTLAAGGAAGLFAWEIGHRALLENYLLNNELAGPERQALLRWIVAAALLALCFWPVGAWALARLPRAAAAAAWQRSAHLLFLGVFLPFIPILAIPTFETRNVVLNLCLVSGLAALAVVGGQQLARDWVPEPPAAGLGLALAALLSLGYIVFFGLYTIARHNAFATHSFDLGIFDQGLYTILHHGVMLSTQHGSATIYHFGRHFSPILYLLAPIYALRQDARTLLVIQSAFLGLGAIPIYLLARRKTGSQLAALLLAASYLLYPALQGVNGFDFSEIALAPVLLLFALYFLESERPAWFAVFLALALLTKEEVALSGAAIGLYILLVRKQPRLGGLVLAACAVYFVVVNLVLMPALGHGPLVGVFAGAMPAEDVGFSGLFTTLLTNPVYIFKYVFLNPGRLIYLWQLLLPVLFLPLLSWRHGYIVLPALALPLLSIFPQHYMIGDQYPATSIPFIFFLAIGAIAALAAGQGTRRWQASGLAGAVLLVSLVMNYQGGLLFSKGYTGLAVPTPHQQVLASFLAQVPPGASVSTMSDIVPHLSSRDRIYLLPIVNDADYILFDGDRSANFWPFVGIGDRGEAVATVLPYLASGAYGVVRVDDGCILLRRGYDTARNGEGLRSLLSVTYVASRLSSDFAASDVADAGAAGGTARQGRPDLGHAAGKDALTWGPFDTLLPGKYRVTFRLKSDGRASPGRLATLDVFSAGAGGPLADRSVAAADFTTPDRYQDFVVDLELDPGRKDVEYRVHYSGRGNLWVDMIRVEPVRVALPGGPTVDLAARP